MGIVKNFILIIYILFTSLSQTWAKEEVKEETPYLLGIGDVIKIVVWDHPKLNAEVEIRIDGSVIYLPIGEIKCVGKTEKELREILIEKLSHYISEPQVSVTVTKYNSKKIYILGEVNKPGEYLINGNTIPLKEAIVKAGLPTKSANLRFVKIITSQPKTIKRVNLSAILYDSIDEGITLSAGDTIYIPTNLSSKLVKFLDEITNPFTKILLFLSLSEQIKKWIN